MFNTQSLRKDILTMAHDGQSVHVGCAFSVIELFAVLYRSFRQSTDAKGAIDNSILLSKGHGVMAQYVCLAELGQIPKEDLKNYFKDGSRLKGLAESEIKGIDISSGSLGHGLSVAVGMALGAKLDNQNRKTFCIVGDGEANEGSIWEALMFASHFKLSNLVVIIDSNKFQAMGRSVDVLNMLDFKSKLSSFGFDCEEVDGHNETQIEQSLKKLLANGSSRPKALVAHTIKGKGVSFMEDNNAWHYSRLDASTYQKAMAELSR